MCTGLFSSLRRWCGKTWSSTIFALMSSCRIDTCFSRCVCREKAVCCEVQPLCAREGKLHASFQIDRQDQVWSRCNRAVLSHSSFRLHQLPDNTECIKGAAVELPPLHIEACLDLLK